MEGAPNKTESENLDFRKDSDGVWCIDDKQLSGQAEELIGSIENFEQKDLVEQKELLTEAVAKKFRSGKNIEEYIQIMNDLGLEVGSIIDEKA